VLNRNTLGEQLAHTLKSVAGNIGAVDVQAASEKLEESIREERPDVESELANLQEKLASLIMQLGNILQAETTVSQRPTDTSPVDAICGRERPTGS
jgi:HPt (histidine-containing phosphotransfer) domain-containing protein